VLRRLKKVAAMLLKHENQQQALDRVEASRVLGRLNR
jgi:hypothetical protein